MDNCLHLLAIADMYLADQLKTLGMELVVKNMNTIVIKGSEDWKKCIKNHLNLAGEIIEEHVKRNHWCNTMYTKDKAVVVVLSNRTTRPGVD